MGFKVNPDDVEFFPVSGHRRGKRAVWRWTSVSKQQIRHAGDDENCSRCRVGLLNPLGGETRAQGMYQDRYIPLFSLLSVFVSCLFIFIFGLFFVPSRRRCPLLAPFLSVSFCLLSLFFFSKHVPGLIWSGSVYLVTTAGFVADQSM